ncbi:MAG TPA: KilA-N domain-containing protein [Williamwhitmania sp.]|nr:KilA-N domain-containing protein [Williamwhitmania sp.]
MFISIGKYHQEIDDLTMMGHLNSLWDYGNSLRIQKKLQPARLDTWLAYRNTCEFIISLQKQVNPTLKFEIIGDLHGRHVIKGSDLTVIKTKRGKSGGTWAHLYLLLKAAAHLDTDFELQIYETFVTNQILRWRDDSGDEFKTLNIAIDAFLPGREGKDNKGVYIQIAMAIKAKVNPDGGQWNTASYDQLELRTLYERRLIDFMRMGLVRNYEHLKELIDNL